MVNNLPAATGDAGSIPGSGRITGGGHNKALQYSCLENPMDREALGPTVHRVANSLTGLKQLSTHACNDYFHQASLIAQLVKNPLAMQETPVRFLGWEDLLEKE